TSPPALPHVPLHDALPLCILDALVEGDGRALVDIADAMLAANAPFERALSELAQRLQRVALAQVGALGDADDPETLQRLAQSIRSEEHTSELQSRENLVCR